MRKKKQQPDGGSAAVLNVNGKLYIRHSDILFAYDVKE